MRVFTRPISRSVHTRIAVWWLTALASAAVLLRQESPEAVVVQCSAQNEQYVRFAPADQTSEPEAAVKRPAEKVGKKKRSPAVYENVNINVNRAGIDDLCRIKGIGPVIAGRIIAYRTENGPFTAVEDLDNVKGIGPKTVEKLKFQNVWAGR